MGTEAVIPFLGIPFLLCLVILIALALQREDDRDTTARTLGLGRKRIAAGYLGALFVAVFVAAWLMQGQLRFRLENGNYPRTELWAYAFELQLFYFILCGWSALFVLTLLGLPGLALLRRPGAAPVAGFVAGAILAGVLLALWWDRPVLQSAFISACVALGFAFGAKLPRLISPAMQAGKQAGDENN